ncbi:hypothetical protein STIAU_0649, partial [Stigmatella aurantiaca DW4/3-1]
ENAFGIGFALPSVERQPYT